MIAPRFVFSLEYKLLCLFIGAYTTNEQLLSQNVSSHIKIFIFGILILQFGTHFQKRHVESGYGTGININ